MTEKVAKNRFPHTCVIYRYVDEYDEEKEIIYEGKCHNYGSSNLRTFKTQNVIKGDYAIDIPELIKGIQGGCYVDVEDFCGKYEGILISGAQPVIYGDFVGTTVYYNLVNN